MHAYMRTCLNGITYLHTHTCILASSHTCVIKQTNELTNKSQTYTYMIRVCVRRYTLRHSPTYARSRTIRRKHRMHRRYRTACVTSLLSLLSLCLLLLLPLLSLSLSLFIIIITAPTLSHATSERDLDSHGESEVAVSLQASALK